MNVRLLLAPDSFKGTFSALEVAAHACVRLTHLHALSPRGPDLWR
jgi:glycerate kinase